MTLSTRDTGRLTRVASFPNMDKPQRRRMLTSVSNDAKIIGRIIIDGARDNDTTEHRRVAAKFTEVRRRA